MPKVVASDATYELSQEEAVILARPGWIIFDEEQNAYHIGDAVWDITLLEEIEWPELFDGLLGRDRK